MRIVKVTGNSMSPSYHDGDYVLTVRYGRRRPRIGDDVVFEHPDFGTVLKRIHRIRGGQLSFTGLNGLSAAPEALGTVSASAAADLDRVAFRLSGR
ncbi:MAG: S24/S26 family peptidase [Pseudomonadota bacterium]